MDYESFCRELGREPLTSKELFSRMAVRRHEMQELEEESEQRFRDLEEMLRRMKARRRRWF